MAFKKGIKSGNYTPINPEKWIITEAFDGKGTKSIKYRSSWEHKFMRFCDYNDNILKVNSEGIVIPYISPLDGKYHRYFMDFIVETAAGIFLVEVKPKAQTLPPKRPQNNSAKSAMHFEKAVMTYAVNKAKWAATEEYCQERGWKFMMITEEELGV
jgi:hypothetical protein